MFYEKYIICSLFIVEYMFCELQLFLLKKVEDIDGDVFEVSVIKIWQQQMQQEQNLIVLVVVDLQFVNGGFYFVFVLKIVVFVWYLVCILYFVICIILKLLFLCLLFSIVWFVEL